MQAPYQKFAIDNTLEITVFCMHGMQLKPVHMIIAKYLVLYLSVVKASYNRKCMFLRPTLHP